MPEMDAYETDKAKADADIAAAQNQSEIIGKENDELGLVSKNIEDEKGNVTRFLIICLLYTYDAADE